MKKFTSAFRFVSPILFLTSVSFINIPTASAATSGSLPATTPGYVAQWGVVGTGLVSGNCNNSGNYISTGTNNNRSSFVVDISSIPNKSIITSVDVTAADRASNSIGGTYKIFARLNGVNIDASSTSATTTNSGVCVTNSSKNINVLDTIKSGTTTLEIGVLKVGTTSPANRTVRIGSLSVVVTYIPPHIVTYIAGINGTILGTTSQIVAHGTNGTTVLAIPDANAYQDTDGNWHQGRGYHFVNWSDGRTDNPRTDFNVIGDISVTANFAVNTITINASVAGNIGGTISPAGTTVVEENNTQSYTITPNTGYHILNVRVDDNDAYNYGPISSYTFPSERTHHNHFIVAVFEANTVMLPVRSKILRDDNKINLPKDSIFRTVLK